MTYQDLLITPIYLAIFYILAYVIRSSVTTAETKKYFIPALSAKFFGAIALGMIYQFYYSGGDTYNYFTYGSRWIWEAFLDNPITGFELLLEPGGERQASTFNFSQNIWYYRDPKAFLIVRITAFFDLFTLHTYSATALFFAAFSFSGLWAFYSAAQRLYPNAKYLAYVILFIPSVVFWGSGILKDTVTFGSLGWLTWALINFVILKRKKIVPVIVALIASVLILKVKSYILLCFIPVVFLMLYRLYSNKIQNTLVRTLMIPVFLFGFGVLGYAAALFTSTEEYNLDNIAQRAAITAYDIRYGWGARTGGDGGYDIGIPDGSWQSMIALAPKAIVVSLFRPFPWEVRNPLMLLAAMESFAISILTFRLIFGGKLRSQLKDPFLLFCISFTLIFGFAVGISTGNFGTLMRYKIPMMPFFLMALTSSIENKKSN